LSSRKRKNKRKS